MHTQNDVKKIATLTREIRDVSKHHDSVALAESLVLRGWSKIPPNRVDYLLSLVADVRAQIEENKRIPTGTLENSDILLLCYAIEKALH